MAGKFRNFSGSGDRCRSRAGILFTGLVCIFLVELCVMIYHSGVMAESNEEAGAWRKAAMEECDRRTVTMGNITDRNGQVLLEFEKPAAVDRGTYIDDYAYSNVIGYYAQNSFGLLRKYAKVLQKTPTLDDTRGSSLTLTLDHELQMAVYEVLKEAIGDEGRGSMVVMDAETGEILSMVSLPTFNVSDLNREMEWMSKDTDVWYPLATVGDLAPGSTFKVLSSIVLLENGMEKHTEKDSEFQAGGHTIHNYYEGTGKKIDYREALRVSSNIFFAKSILSIENAAEKLTEAAGRLYIGTDLELDFGPVTSNWSLNEDTLEALRGYETFNMDYVLASTSFGQSEVRFSAMNGAMLAAAVMNDGKLITPYMIEAITDCRGKTVAPDSLDVEGLSGAHGTLLSQVTSAEIAGKIRSAMQEAAEQSYGFDPALHVAAKSGTAESGMKGNAGNSAWMISGAEINGHKYAVAINWANAGKGIIGSYMKKPVEKIYRVLEQSAE